MDTCTYLRGNDMSIEQFDTRAAFDDAVLAVIGRADRTLVCFDVDLNGHVLCTAAGCRALESFLRGDGKRTATFLLHDAGYLARHGTRLVELYRQRRHQAAILIIAAADRGQLQPFVTADGKHLATRFHADHSRGKLALDEARETAYFSAQLETLIPAATPAEGLEILGI